MFVTAQGSPWTRFRRALHHGNLLEARSAASELEHVGLAEALELVLLIAEKEPERLGRAALRWHGRYTHEVRGVDTDEARAVLALLVLLAGARREQACRALAELCDRRELHQCGEVLLKTAVRPWNPCSARQPDECQARARWPT
jgi:hypothetical protein